MSLSRWAGVTPLPCNVTTIYWPLRYESPTPT